MVADELARWGDWRNAIWIWESVLASRPYVVAIMSNVARGYISLGDAAKAQEYLARAKQLQPRAPSVRSLEVIVLSRTAREAEALALARRALAEGAYDLDLVNAAIALGWRAGDFRFVDEAVRQRMAGWPESRVQGYVQLGNLYATQGKDAAKAVDAFRHALDLLPAGQREALLPYIPAAYRASLGLPAAAPAPAAAPQTSASNG
jgi:tetratricopeptide (TPR) repeat protein